MFDTGNLILMAMLTLAKIETCSIFIPGNVAVTLTLTRSMNGPLVTTQQVWLWTLHPSSSWPEHLHEDKGVKAEDADSPGNGPEGRTARNLRRRLQDQNHICCASNCWPLLIIGGRGREGRRPGFWRQWSHPIQHREDLALPRDGHDLRFTQIRHRTRHRFQFSSFWSIYKRLEVTRALLCVQSANYRSLSGTM